MHYLFYGENTFLIQEKVKSLETKFKAVQGDGAGIIKLEGERITQAEIIEAVFTLSFFENKKLVEIKNLLIGKSPVDLREFILKNLEKMPAETIVIFIEEGLPDMRTALFKALNRPRFAQKFSDLSSTELNQWIKTKVTELGGQITAEAVSKLILFVGSDLWRLGQEIEKLVLYRQENETIKPADVDSLVWAENNQNVFDFIDTLAGKNQAKAVSIFHRLVASGQNEQYLFSMMVYQYRQMLIVADLIAGNVPAGSIASKAKIHPFVVKKILSVLQHYDQNELERIYQKLKDCDASIKSGEVEGPLAFDLLLLDICRK